jgi:hypothetical protein
MLRRVAQHIFASAQASAAAAAEPGGLPEHPPLGSLEGATPELRCWTTAELGTASAGGASAGAAPAEFPAALPDDNAAVEQFRRFGYVAVTDALRPEALARVLRAYKAKQPRARAVYDASMAKDEAHASNPTSNQFFDLPREDMDTVAEAYGSGNWGGYLVTKEPEDFSTFFDAHANPQVLLAPS